jgi:hypothetical protein
VISSEVYSHSGVAEAVVAASGASAPSVARVSAVAAVSAAGAVAPSAVFSLRWPVVLPSADVLAPASAVASASPFAASLAAFPVLAGISSPVSDFPCLEEPDGPCEEYHSGGLPAWKRCSPDA